jgi:hypothetical protein
MCVMGNWNCPVDILLSYANARCTMCIAFLPYPSLLPLWLIVVPLPRPGVIRNPMVSTMLVSKGLFLLLICFEDLHFSVLLMIQ